jgi:beta-glucanase (GH16 family)
VIASARPATAVAKPVGWAAVPRAAVPRAAVPRVAVPRAARTRTAGTTRATRTVRAALVAGITALAVITSPGVSRAPAMASSLPAAASPVETGLSAGVVVENWRGYSGPFRKTHDLNRIVVVSARGATDGKALKLQLDPHPGTGPRMGVEIASNNPAFRYGTFGTRMKTANCAGQVRPGVVTGTFTYSMDHSDANANGLPDNDEIDFEVLCAQPEVIWMSIWTDYDELTETPRKISRAVDVRTGQVIYNCYLMTWTGSCEPLMVGEDSPATVTPVPGFNSATQFHSYWFRWQPNRIRFYATGSSDAPILLWDYQGLASRIPQKTAMFLQNVWHTDGWDPFNGRARNVPTRATSAYLDSSTVPRWTTPPWPPSKP